MTKKNLFFSHTRFMCTYLIELYHCLWPQFLFDCSQKQQHLQLELMSGGCIAEIQRQENIFQKMMTFRPIMDFRLMDLGAEKFSCKAQVVVGYSFLFFEA